MTNKPDKIKNLLGELVELLTEKEVDTTSVVVTIPVTFTVKSHDETKSMTWHEAMAKFGPHGTDKDWRLPTKEELHVIFNNKERIPSLDPDGWYWSSSEYSSYTGCVWTERFSDGHQFYVTKNYSYKVRCLRR